MPEADGSVNLTTPSYVAKCKLELVLDKAGLSSYFDCCVTAEDGCETPEQSYLVGSGEEASGSAPNGRAALLGTCATTVCGYFSGAWGSGTSRQWHPG